MSVRELRELEREHPGWWKVRKQEIFVEQIPEDADDVRDLAIGWLVKYEGRKHEMEIFVGYLIGACSLDREVVRAALMDVWPDAAALVQS